MLDLQKIRRSLAAQIQSRITRTPNVYPYMPEAPALPAIAIVAGNPYVTYYETFGADGVCDVQFEVRIAVEARAIDAQILLDDLLSVGAPTTSSVIDAIASDPTLGGAVATCICRTAQMIPRGETNAQIFEAVIPVEIWLHK